MSKCLLVKRRRYRSARILAFDFSGFMMELSSKVCRHSRSFVGRDLKLLAQLHCLYLVPTWSRLMRLKCGLHYPRYSSYNVCCILPLICHIYSYVTNTHSIDIISMVFTINVDFIINVDLTNFLLKPECRYICTSFIESVKMFSRATKEVKGSPYSPFG